MSAIKYLIAVLMMAAAAQALEVGSVSVAPDIWLGNPVNISAACSNENETITRVYVDISGAGIVLPSLDMNGANGEYTLSVARSYFDRRGNYAANVICTAGNLTANRTASFQLSELTSTIKYVQTPSYTGDIMQIIFVPKKNDVIINNPAEITFAVMFDNEPRILNSFYYDASQGWILRVEAPAPKTYTMTVTGTYQGATVSSSQQVVIKPQVEFGIINIDKNSVKYGDNITLEIKAARRDVPINLDNLAIYINNATAAIYSTVQNGGIYTIKAGIPNMAPGRYQLSMEITNNGTLYITYMNVSYVSVLSGKITEKNMQLKLFKSGAEVYRISALSDGTYSSNIVPDTYDATMEFTDATVNLEGANINQLDNPVDYSYSQADVEGFDVARLYHIKIPWSFSKATVKLRYDPSYLEDEENIYVFKCTSWNSGKCSSVWTKIIPEIYRDQKLAVFTVSSFSSFIVGNEESLKVSMNFDKNKYAKRDLISIRGAVTAGGSAVKNATIRIKIEDTYVDHTLYSNQNGAFTVDFLGPESEGNYTLTVTAVKAPYISYSETRNIEIVNMPSLSIVFPGSVQVKENSTKDEDVFIVNTGQSRITGLRIETDLDENYYQVGEVPDTLDMKQEVHIPIKFFGDGDIGTQSANLRIISNEFNQEKTFGFTILENMPAAQAVTGFAFSMPDMSGAYPIIAIAAGAFAAAFLLKKFRKSVHRPIIHMNHAQNEKRGIDDVSLYLNDVKTHLRRKT